MMIGDQCTLGNTEKENIKRDMREQFHLVLMKSSYSFTANLAAEMKEASQAPPPSPATLHRMKISSANKNNSGSDYDSEYDTRDGMESTVSLPTIGTRPGTRGEPKFADSGIEEQDEKDDSQGRMKVSIVISVEDEMGRHIDVNIEDEAGGQMDVETPGELTFDL